MLLYSFEFLPELIRSHVIHLAQFIQLPQGQFGLAQITQAWLSIVLCYVLVSCGFSTVEFVEYHTDIYTVGAAPAAGGAAAPTAGCCPGAAAGALRPRAARDLWWPAPAAAKAVAAGFPATRPAPGAALSATPNLASIRSWFGVVHPGPRPLARASDAATCTRCPSPGVSSPRCSDLQGR